MTVEENMFVAVQALRFEWVDHNQFVEACHRWAQNKSMPMGNVLESQGHLDTAQRQQLEKLLESTVRAGGAKQALALLADLPTRDTIRAVEDREVQHTLAGLAPANRVRLATLEDAEETSETRYRLTSEYSRGGLSRIWLARDANLHRDVILKELHPKLGDDTHARRRFLNEAHITGQLEHPNIVPVYELGQQSANQMPFYAMRFLRGDTLRKMIARHHEEVQSQAETLENRRMLGIFVSVCNAIAYAHSRGVLHRDLKPENVVLGSFGEVILLDWGLAKLAGEGDAETEGVRIAADHDPMLTAEGDVLGTPAYLAPELARGRIESVDERTDVYGLGGILFEMLTGRAPHQGETTGAVIMGILHEDTPLAMDVNPNVPTELNAICAKAMAKDSKNRYASAMEVVEDVQRYLGDEPVSAYPEPLPARARRWMRHHQTTTALVSFLLLGVLVALGNLWWQHSKAVANELEMLGGESREGIASLLTALDYFEKDVMQQARREEVSAALIPGASGAEARAELAHDFMGFLGTEPNILQIRLLDSTGMELVRVEQSPSSEGGQSGPETVKDVDLQFKGDQPYFEEAEAEEDRDFYLSKVSLNKEDGVLQEPDTPVIRAVHRVRHKASGHVGYVVINRDFKPFFEMLQSSRRGGGVGSSSPALADAVFFADHDGEYIWNPLDTTKTFLSNRDPKDIKSPSAWRLHGSHPELGAFFQPGADQEKELVLSRRGEERLAIYAQRITLGGKNTNARRLCIAATAPYSKVLARADRYTRVPLITTICLVAALLSMIAWAILLTRRQSNRERESSGV